MISFLFFPFVFAIAYALKGGQGDDVFTNWHSTPITKIGNKAISVLFLFVCLCVYTVLFKVNLGVMPMAWQSIVVILIGWLGSVSPAVDFTSAVEGDFKESLKDGFVRGSVIGACMAIVTGSIIFIPFAWLYGLIAFVGLQYGRKIWRFDKWAMVELFIGAICFGLPMGLSL